LLIEQDVEPKRSRCELEKQQHICNNWHSKNYTEDKKNPTSLHHKSIMGTKVPLVLGLNKQVKATPP